MERLQSSVLAVLEACWAAVCLPAGQNANVNNAAAVGLHGKTAILSPCSPGSLLGSCLLAGRPEC
jgi:hypothetical protein